MISTLFKKATPDDLIEELKNKSFNESKVNSMLKNLDINHQNQNMQNYLHLIVPENRIESVKWLIRNGINTNETDVSGVTPLMLASQRGLIDTVEELIKHSSNTEMQDYHGYSAIDYAILNNKFNVYKKLKEHVKDINKKNKKNQNLLHLAIKVDNHKVIDDLHADPNFNFSNDILFYKNTYAKKEVLNSILSKFDSFNQVDKYNRNILFYVVTNGVESEEVFHHLVENGLEINHLDNFGNNILFHLIYFIVQKKDGLEEKKISDEESSLLKIKNLIDFIPVLVEKGVHTNISNNNHETILTIATKNNCTDILETLFEYDVEIDIVSDRQETALNSIITKGSSYLQTIYFLIDYGANPNIQDIEGKSVIEKLIEAVLITKNYKKVKISQKKNLDFSTDYMALLEALLFNTDTKLTILNSNKEPYFFEALRHGYLELVKMLIKHGADINQTNEEGLNIIYSYMEENQSFKKEAELREYHNNLQAIIMMGANVNAKDSFGGITLHKAILNRDMTTIKLLLHGGADINAIDNRGRNILHNTIWKNDLKMFKLIYTYNKVLINEPDKFGVLPINYAAFLGYTDLVLEIIELNAHINNPHKKSKYILNFLKKFHKNLKELIDNARTREQKTKLKMLIDNMKKEFEVKD